jgi:protein-L-isoaspartate(D-aspartate) O-methyltransferase
LKNSIDINTLHNSLIDYLVEKELIKSEAVEAAFRIVPRHLFLPEVSAEEVYKDQAIPTRFDEDGLPISSSSQPAIMAIMLEQLALRPNYNVLEVGAGTGYNAALMGHLVGEGGRVTTLDLDDENVTAARDHLNSAGCGNVTVVCGDGMAGFTGNAPYDAIILTVGGWEIAPVWLEQLKPDGRILLPLSLNGPQLSIAFDREKDGLKSVSIEPCGFMRLRGPNAGMRKVMTLNELKTIHVGYEDDRSQPRPLYGDQLNAWLVGPHEDIGSGIQITFREIWQSFLLWLALHEPHLIDLNAKEEAIEMIPVLMGWGSPSRWGMTIGMVGEAGMAFFERPLDWTAPEDNSSDESVPFELFIRGFGSADLMVEQLKQYVLDWDADGRPGIESLRLRVVPIDDAKKEALVLRRRWHQFIIDWPYLD